MCFVEQLRLLDYLDALITRKGTGTPKQLARRLDISRASVFRQISMLKLLGAKIKFCHHANSYIYIDDFNLGNLGSLKF